MLDYQISFIFIWTKFILDFSGLVLWLVRLQISGVGWGRMACGNGVVLFEVHVLICSSYRGVVLRVFAVTVGMYQGAGVWLFPL